MYIMRWYVRVRRECIHYVYHSVVFL
jgi:hypothetical protein